MPIMDGLTMIARIRANPSTRGIPVLMVTTESSEEIRARGRACVASVPDAPQIGKPRENIWTPSPN
jgi:CheY-like chemotaxis protein